MKTWLDSLTATLKNRDFWQTLLVRCVFILLILVLWQIIYVSITRRADAALAALFPSPGQVWNSLLHGFSGTAESQYPNAIVVSLWRLIRGYMIAIVIGFPAGLAVARWKLAKQTIGWLSLSLQAMPS